MNKLYYEEDLTSKVRNGKCVVDWINSIGKEVRFEYNSIKDKLLITGYNSKTQAVEIKYKNVLYTIHTHRLKECCFEKLFSNIFLYKVNDIINNNIKITDCFFKLRHDRNEKEKWYKYTCLVCGWNGGEIRESDLRRDNGCKCCAGKIVVPGINDIPTTASWMVPYFQGGYEEAKQYTKGSHKKIYPKCPDCGKIRNKSIQIGQIYKRHSIGCGCGDSKTYPNKFIIGLLCQLKVDFDYEVVFSWAQQYRYDAVIYLIDKSEHLNITIEMDGGLGHGNEKSYGKKSILEQREEILDDMNKEICSLKNWNYHVRIDCLKSDKDYIKNNILNSKLAEWYDLSNIDWDECDKFANKNIIKEMAKYINKYPNVNYDILSKKFYISKGTVAIYLKKAKDNGMISDALRIQIMEN